MNPPLNPPYLKGGLNESSKVSHTAVRSKKDRPKSKEDIFVVEGRKHSGFGLNFRWIIPLWIVKKSLEDLVECKRRRAPRLPISSRGVSIRSEISILSTRRPPKAEHFIERGGKTDDRQRSGSTQLTNHGVK